MKSIIFFIFFIFTSFMGFAQMDITEAITILDKPVPPNYTKLNENTFSNDSFQNGSFLIITNDSGIVILSQLGYAFDTESKAKQWLTNFYKTIEDQNWILLQEYDNEKIYQKNRIYLLISLPSQNYNGIRAANIGIAKDLELLQ